MTTYTQHEFIEACKGLEAFNKMKQVMLAAYTKFDSENHCDTTDHDLEVFIEGLEEAFYQDIQKWKVIEEVYNSEEDAAHKAQESRGDLYV